MVDGKLLGRQRVSGGRKIRSARQALLVTSLIVMEIGHSRMVQAGLGDWKPVFANYSSKLTLQSAYTTDDKLTNKGVSQTSATQSLRQSITLSTVGYVYHPDLMLFRLSGDYGTDQTIIEDNDNEPSKRRGGFEGYDLESKFFRAKPYTLELFTKQESPFIVLSDLHAGKIRQESKADFRYLKQGQRAGLKYHNTTNTEAQRSNSIDDYDSYYGFAKPKLGKVNNFSFNAATRYQENSTTSLAGDGGTAVSQTGSLSNSFGYSMFDFNTNLNSSTAHLDSSGDEGYASDSVGFSEGIKIRLPWDFESNIDYRKALENFSNEWTEASSNPTNPLEIPMRAESSTNDQHASVALRQTLYDSLETNFSATRDSRDTSRIKQRDAISEKPVDGLEEHNVYGMETRYRKLLPHQSTVTASLSSRGFQTKRLGLSAEPKIYPATKTDGELAFGLDPETDTNSKIDVDVLKTDDVSCEAALNNPSAESACWSRLHESDYELTLDNTRPQVRIFLLANGRVPGVDYQFYNADNPLFKFRVTSYRKAVDATVKTSQFSTGLTLFQFISSNYQHAETTREGTYGNAAVEPKTILDTMALSLLLYDWSFRASQEWRQGRDMLSKTDFSVGYSKSKKFWERLTVRLGAGAKKGWANSDRNSSSGAQSSTEGATEGFTYSLSGDMPLPYIQASLRADHIFDYSKGQTLLYNAYGLPTPDLGITEQTSFQNSISLSKHYRIPWINLTGSGYARYRWLTQTTNNEEAKDKSYLAYGVNAGRDWKFGATSINLKADYAFTEDVFDENTGRNSLFGFTEWQRVDQTNKTSVMLTVIRQLF